MIVGACFILAAVALGFAIQVRNGLLDPTAVQLLGVAVAASAVAMALSPGGRVTEREAWGLRVLLAGGITANTFLLLTSEPGFCCVSAGESPYRWVFDVGLAVGGGVALIGLLPSRRIGQAQVPVLLGIHALLGIWIIASTPSPISYMDVYLFQRDAAAATLAAENPYAITFPDLYGQNSGYYPPGFVQDGRTTFGFPYPPLSLALALPGYVLGDIRFAHLAALTISGALIATARPTSLARGATAIALFTPRSFFVTEQSWTEPFALMLFAALLFVTVRGMAGRGIFLGLIASAKQYLLPILPLVLVLERRRGADDWKSGLRQLGIAAMTAALVTLPLALLDVGAFLHSVAWLHLLGEFRSDSLSFNAARVVATGAPPLPGWLPYAAALTITGIALVRRPRGPGSFMAASAMVLFALFVLGRQAFANYYFLVIGVLGCGLAALAAESGIEATEEKPPTGGS